MSVCTCTPKQKDSGRYSRRCTAHNGYDSTAAYAERKRPTRKPKKAEPLSATQREWLTEIGERRLYGEYEMPLGVRKLIEAGLARIDSTGYVRPTATARAALRDIDEDGESETNETKTINEEERS